MDNETERPSGLTGELLRDIAGCFRVKGRAEDAFAITKGYVNRTYCVVTRDDDGTVSKYLLQKINTNVFRDVDALTENFRLTTEHLRDRFILPGSRGGLSVQTAVETADGGMYLRRDGCWRMMSYVDGVYSLDIPDSEETFFETGRAFGKFVREMSDVDVNDVKTVIPHFHDTPRRYRDLEAAVSRDAAGRVQSVLPEIAFVREHAPRLGIIGSALDSGMIPYRVCHNDCSLNNVLFDAATHLPAAVIDLDTVMPSTPLYDFGDSMRIGTNTAKDDEKDLSKVSCDLSMYEAYARGYLGECGSMLTEAELLLLPYAAPVITSEDGIRFLADHIDGDTYYNILYPGQNLDRARTQLALLADMEKKLPEIKKILHGLYTRLGLPVPDGFYAARGGWDA